MSKNISTITHWAMGSVEQSTSVGILLSYKYTSILSCDFYEWLLRDSHITRALFRQSCLMIIFCPVAQLDSILHWTFPYKIPNLQRKMQYS